jgi:acetyl esterase/lipase
MKYILAVSGLFITINFYSQEKLNPTFSDISYGPHERNIMDVFLAESDQPAPALLMIHGGGFRGGDKSMMNGTFLKTICENGISVISINYRLIPENQLKDAFHDGVRALQFIRIMSEEWNTNVFKQ